MEKMALDTAKLDLARSRAGAKCELLFTDLFADTVTVTAPFGKLSVVTSKIINSVFSPISLNNWKSTRE